MRHGLGMRKILGTIHSYPTLTEANKYAAGNWKKLSLDQVHGVEVMPVVLTDGVNGDDVGVV